MMILDGVSKLDELYRLDNIIRYNTLKKHKHESVATHSFYTALFTMMLCNDIMLHDDNVVRCAISYALIHDIPEIITNDITHDVKCRYPRISKLMEEYENEIYYEEFPYVMELFNTLSSAQEDLVMNIVKLADILSVLQFASYEISMGNVELRQWLDSIHERIGDAKYEIERLGYSCQRIMNYSL